MIDDVTSVAFHVTYVAPRHLLLCSLLYLVYVDTMRLYLTDICLTLFADDTALTIFSRCLHELILKTNGVLNSFHIFISSAYYLLMLQRVYLI